MKILKTLLFIFVIVALPSLAFSADVIRYVNPGADAAGDGTTAALSSGDSTHAYDSMSAWESNENTNLVVATNTMTAICAGSTADTTKVIVAGWITSSTYDVTIKTDESDRHDGTWDTSKFRSNINASAHGTYNIQIATNHVTIEGLQINQNSGPVWNGNIGILAQAMAAGSILTITDNIIKSGDGNCQRGLYLNDSDTIFNVFNNIIYGFDTEGARTQDVSGFSLVHHNTLYNNVAGLHLNSEAPTVSNNISVGNSGADYSSTTNATMSNNVDEDGTGEITGTPTFEDVGAGTEDFHLASGDTVAMGAGTDLTGTVDTDIDGDSRATTPDCGADEFVAGGTTFIPKIMWLN